MTDIVERLRDKWMHSEEDCYKAADEIERLRAALEPFARFAEIYDRGYADPDDDRVLFYGDRAKGDPRALLYRDFHRARTALKEA